MAAWDGKKFWHFWRPITAIQEGDTDGNSKTAGDATWLPQIATFTPPYPEYPSGANSLTGAMTRTLERFFGDRMTFSVMSAFVNQTKTYHRFSDMADDVVNVRIYRGIHFCSADEVARRHGKRVADLAFRHSLRPSSVFQISDLHALPRPGAAESRREASERRHRASIADASGLPIKARSGSCSDYSRNPVSKDSPT